MEVKQPAKLNQDKPRQATSEPEYSHVLRARVNTLEVENRILRERIAAQRNLYEQLKKSHQTEFNSYREALHECLDDYDSNKSECWWYCCWCTTSVRSLIMNIHSVIISMNRNQLHRQTCEHQSH